eukprot:9361854-Pyramimonas_sp.AAC.1
MTTTSRSWARSRGGETTTQMLALAWALLCIRRMPRRARAVGPKSQSAPRHGQLRRAQRRGPTPALTADTEPPPGAH